MSSVGELDKCMSFVSFYRYGFDWLIMIYLRGMQSVKSLGDPVG